MSKETREYAKQLVSQMTLEEKMSQMVYQSPAIERLGIPAYNWWNEALHGVAELVWQRYFRRLLALQQRLIKSCCRRSVMLFLPRTCKIQRVFEKRRPRHLQRPDLLGTERQHFP